MGRSVIIIMLGRLAVVADAMDWPPRSARPALPRRRRRRESQPSPPPPPPADDLSQGQPPAGLAPMTQRAVRCSDRCRHRSLSPHHALAHSCAGTATRRACSHRKCLPCPGCRACGGQGCGGCQAAERGQCLKRRTAASCTALCILAAQAPIVCLLVVCLPALCRTGRDRQQHNPADREWFTPSASADTHKWVDLASLQSSIIIHAAAAPACCLPTPGSISLTRDGLLTALRPRRPGAAPAPPAVFLACPALPRARVCRGRRRRPRPHPAAPAGPAGRQGRSAGAAWI